MEKQLTLLIFIGLLVFYHGTNYAQGKKEIQWISFEQLHDSLKVNTQKSIHRFLCGLVFPLL